jgi:hypothetical protein
VPVISIPFALRRARESLDSVELSHSSRWAFQRLFAPIAVEMAGEHKARRQFTLDQFNEATSTLEQKVILSHG